MRHLAVCIAQSGVHYLRMLGVARSSQTATRSSNWRRVTAGVWCDPPSFLAAHAHE